MIKINNKRILKNSFIISSTLAGFSAIGVGATLFSLHSKETVENTTVYGNLLQAENLFKIYSPYIDVSEQEKTKFNDDFQQAKEGWKSKNKNLKEKLSIADTTLEKILNFYIENIDKINIKDQKNEIFWNEVLKNQLNRIREIDLQKQHKHLKEDARNKFLEILKTTNYEQKQQHLKTLASQISEYVVSQNKILNPFIEILEGASSKLEKVPYEGLKKDLAKSLKPLYLRIISNDIHLNEVQIASQRTSEEILKLDQMLSKIQKEINEIDEYLNLIEPHIENSAYTQLQKQNIESFVEWAKMNLNLALNENDINQIRNTVVTFYHQISDEKRTLEEIKSVLSNLNVYLEELNPLLKNNKNWINNLIVKALEINDKHELISRKASVFSEFYALKFSNQIINQANSEIDLALQNKIIISKKAIMLKSQITSIISKNLWPKEQAKELFDFYNLVNQELHTLGYLNNELMLVEAQINDIKALKFTNNQVQNQLSELKNQVIKTYLNEVSSSYLSSIKDKFNESLRMILKDHLKNLNYLIENKIKMLKKHKTNVNDELIAKFEKIDQNLTEILKDFATVSTSEIVEKIKNNHFKLQNLESAYNQTVAENWSDSADDYLKAVFSSDEENYVPSGGEQSRINLYNEVKEQLKDLRSKINTGDGNPLTAQKVEELTNKLQNLINTANKFRDLSLLQKQVQAFVNTVMQSDNSVILKPYTDNIQAFQIEILELFKNVYATNEQVQGFIEQLNLSFKELKDADTSRLLNEKIEELKDKLYQNYGDNPSTPGAKALNELYNQLLSDSNNFSNNESSKITNKLIDLSNDLFEAENVKEKLLEIIGEKSSAQYSDVKTQKKIQDALEQIQKFDDLIAQLSDSTNIPDPEQFNQIKNSLNGLENEILLAYEQDKIQKINFSIQNYNNQKSTNHNPSYSEAIKKINDYALENSKNLTLEETTKIANKLEKINQLANLSNELLNKYQSSDKNSKSLISEYIANLLNENKLESTDSEEEIEAKIQNLKTAQESIETKKEFLNSYSKINDLLKDKDKKIFEKISGEITSIAQKSNSILNNKNLTEEQLQEEKAKIDVEFELLKRKKEEILHSYNEAITKSDEQFSSLDSDISKLKNLHSNYNFGNYYQKLKETYNAKKTDDNKENLQSYQEKAQIAFYKDLVLNKLKDIETFENTFSSNSNPLYVKIKEQKQKFEGHLKDKIENSNLSLDEVKNLANNADTFFELFNTQKNVVEYINELEKDSSEKAQNATKIQALKDVLEKNQLSSESDYSNPSDKKEILESSYNSNATIELKRSNLNKVLDNNSSGPAGIIQRFEEKLGSSFDTQVKIQLNDYVNSLKKELENSNDTSFASVREKVKKLNDLVVPISEVAKAVGIANDKINSLKNTNSPLISEYKKNLNDLISQTQSNYFKNLDKANNYKDLLNKINESTQKLQKAESLSNKLEEINKITSLNTFNLEFWIMIIYQQI
ncbi:Uncharacterised protein [Mycoplasmopsis citelli]|uniref:Uncharacterized protein n=1 Tax=Mycoplasmopsis citelli TaxID=171281 RepID=A0A449B1D3_9BACT|nr:hypothetical protein [Mycoplasmopsis citelli]VEU74354.1 Uncharacterised protein [Mycoplasmopsis citelli]